MKTKLTYIILASALLLSSACQKERNALDGQEALSFSISMADTPAAPQTKSIVEFTDENGDPAPFDITLSVEDYIAEPQTKGTPISTLDQFTDRIKDFRVWGWFNNPTSNATFENYKWRDVNNVKVIQYAGSDYRPYDGADYINGYYPTDNNYKNNTSNYRFFAIAPYDLTKTGVETITASRTGGLNISFPYTSPDNDDEDAVAQEEVLAGYLEAGNATATRIKMTFKPILAAIQFKVSTAQLGRNVKINSIEIKNVYASGTCTVKLDGISWTQSGTQKNSFKQTFDFGISESVKGKPINDSDLTKTFFIIPQTGLSEITGGVPTGTMIVVNYSEDGETGGKDAVHLLFGQQFEAGKTYIFNIGNFEGDALKMEPWVEFSSFDVNATNLLESKNEIHEENNSKFSFDFRQRGGTYEKSYFKIHNLEVGHWYSIEFTENLSLKGSNNTPFGNVGTYACRVSETENKATDQASMIAFYGATDNYDSSDTEDNPPFVWQHPEGIYNSTKYKSLLSDAKTAKITFKATAELMYWVWDYSRGDDGSILRAEIYMPFPGRTIKYYNYADGTTTDKTFTTGEKIKDITPEEGVPTVDFLNATLYNTYHSSNNYGNSSNKSYAVDATAGAEPVSGSLVFRVVNTANGNLARVNIPLTNLVEHHSYKLTYTVIKEAGTKRNGQNFGFVIQESSITDNNAFNGVSGYKSYNGTLFDAATFNMEKEEYTFEASAEKMYWVWDFSNFGVGNTAHQFVTFKDVKIEEVTP